MVDIIDLIKREKWEIISKDGIKHIEAFGQQFGVTHPVQVYLKLYRHEKNPDLKFLYLKAAHDYLWPKTIWHYWTEDRFRDHCNGHNYIGWAGGASCSKSYDAAKLAVLFWLANPRKRGVVVASTTLESLSARVWGYCTDFLSQMEVRLPFQYLGGQSPKILYPVDKTVDKNEIRSTRHGMFAIAALQGNDEKAISSTIGRHPDDALMVILDESTDLNIAIAKAFPNLDSSEKPFQLIGIGNSNSMHDLHGAICTPKEGWPSIDPLVDTVWPTVHKNGICRFFNCYNSPAVNEADPVKKKRLSSFLITQEQIDEKEQILGKDSDSFYRFVLGFWKSTATDRVVMSHQFLNGHNIKEKAEWMGINPLMKVAGLDPAFSTGGDKCLLQIGILGQDIDGRMVLDFRGNDLLFNIKIKAIHSRLGKSAELQISEQVCDILIREGVSLENLAIDSNGQGRAIGGTLYLEMAKRIGQLKEPLKIYSTKGGENVVNSFGMIIKTAQGLWDELRTYIEHDQIKGINFTAAAQLANRLVIQDEKTLKQRLQTKAEFKKRMSAVNPSLAHSPDEADCAAICLQSAIHNFGFALGQKVEMPRVESFAHEKLLAYRAEQQVIVMEAQSAPGFTPQVDFGTSLENFAQSRRPF